MDDSRKKDLSVGLIVVASIVVLAWGYNFLKGQDFFKSYNDFYIKLNSSEGIVKGSSVSIKGVNVGSVSRVSLDDDYRIVIEFSIPSEIKVARETRAEIYSPDLINGKEIRLLLPDKFSDIAEDGDTLSVIVESSIMDQIAPQLDTMLPDLKSSLSNINSITSSLDKTLNTSTSSNFQNTITNLNTISQSLEILTRELAQNTYLVNQILQNTSGFTQNLNKNNASINSALQNLNSTSQNLAETDIKSTVASLDQSVQELNQVLTKINNADGSLGLLINDKGLYYRLNSTTESLNSLLDDIQKNPKRYINVKLIGNK